MTAIPKTLELTQAKLQSRVSDIYRVSPFSEDILRMTTVQMLWIIKSDLINKGIDDNNESFIDEDYEEKKKQALGE